MYKTLIVDDFIADRRNLREILGKLPELNLEIVAECENGLEALKEIEKCKPDIVISDIEMPLTDGFELARNLRQQHPEIKIIFCSLYDEFEYARNALYFGGYGYILKPIDPEELKLCIQKVTGQLTTEATLLKHKQEYDEIRIVLEEYKPVLAEDYIKELIYGENKRSDAEIWDRIGYLDIVLEKGGFVLAYIEIDDLDKITRLDQFEQKQIFFIKIFNRIKEVLSREGSKPIVRLGDSHFAVVINFPGDSSPTLMMKKAYDCCDQVLLEFVKSDVSLTITLSEPRCSINEIKYLYEQCLYQMKHKFLLGKGKIILPEDVPSTRQSIDLDFNSIQKEVMFLLNSGTRRDIEQFVNHLFSVAAPCADIKYFRNLCFCTVICIQIQLNENNENFKEVFESENLIWEELLRFETIVDAASWINNILTTSNEYLAAKSKSRNVQIVEKVKKYIDSNYGRNFNLDIMAVDLFYSPNYLTRVFKQEMGETIFDYCTSFKIEKAKEMLREPKIKLSGVSEELGYSNPAYFSFIFKKATGLTPKEFRERNVL